MPPAAPGRQRRAAPERREVCPARKRTQPAHTTVSPASATKIREPSGSAARSAARSSSQAVLVLPDRLLHRRDPPEVGPLGHLAHDHPVGRAPVDRDRGHGRDHDGLHVLGHEAGRAQPLREVRRTIVPVQLPLEAARRARRRSAPAGRSARRARRRRDRRGRGTRPTRDCRSRPCAATGRRARHEWNQDSRSCTCARNCAS